MGFRWRARGRDRAPATTVVSITPGPVVVTAFPLTDLARERLGSLLGNVTVHDIRDIVLEVDLVLVPACSPNTVAALKLAYPTAQIVVVELEDWEFNVNFSGPVKRLLSAGADAYFTANSIEHLASQLARRVGAPPDAGVPPVELGSASVDDVILANVRDLARRRTQAP